jgi:competence protein ComEC
VVAFGAGVAFYFGLSFEPNPIWIAGVLVALTALWRWRSESWVLIALLMVFAGLGRASWHAGSAKTLTLPERPLTYDLTGWVEGIERGNRGLRWIVRVQDIDSRVGAPHRVRLNVGEREIKVGQGVVMRARLSAPPAPALPGGYDSARAAYFRGIGGYGQLYEVEPIALDVGWEEVAPRALAGWRHTVADRIAEAAPEETAGLQSALITGVRYRIEPAQYDAMRDAGLAHIVAISGLHMSVFAGYAYAAFCFLRACTPLGRRWDMRKVAAGAALIIATFYLALSGASVSTQRAYIMIAVWLGAVILERQPFSLRSVNVAAFLTLMIHPESLLSAGFHMSFAAVAALIVVYGAWNARREVFPESRLRRAVNGFGSLAATSAIAGTATAGYAVLHFGRLAKYGLPANLAAMPFFTFITMPMAMVALLAMPFGGEALPLAAMGWSLEWVLRIAEGVVAWPGAVSVMPGAGALALIVFTLGMILLLLGRDKVRLAGLVTLLAIPLTAYRAPSPDMRVSDRAYVTVMQEGSLYGLNLRGDRFGRMLFAERAGLVEEVRPLSDIARCNDLGCDLNVRGQRVVVVHAPSEVAAACEQANLVVLTERAANPNARRNCEAVLVDAESLRESGALDIVIGDGVGLRPVKTAGRATRPWGR